MKTTSQTPVMLYIFVMALVTYLVRMLPFTLLRRRIRSPFLRSLMHYIPYAVLAAMTIPAIFYSTGNALTAVAGTLVALLLAYREKPLIVVALSASVAALATGAILGIM